MDVFTCGYDSQGMLSTATLNYLKPTKVDFGGKSVADIKCCATSAYILTPEGEVYCFSYGDSTQGYDFVSQPTLNTSLKDIKITAISCGLDHTLVLSDTGAVYSWGANILGQLGLGNTEHTITPQLIEMPENVLIKQISCGNHHSLVLTTNGQIYSFGDNELGQLGILCDGQLLPELIESKIKFSEVYAFGNTSMALSETNQVWVWGQSLEGNLFYPMQTNVDSFQEAINNYFEKEFTYKPITGREAFHRNKLIETMAKAFNEQTFSDFKFKLKHKGSEEFDYIFGHKSFIAKTSEYFEAMFANQWSENENNEIQINGYSYEAYYLFVRCLYTDSIETEDMELLFEIMGICDEYLNEEIKTKCVQNIKPLISLQNVCSVYSCSLRHISEELEEFCVHFMSSNIQSLAATEEFLEMNPKYTQNLKEK